MSQPQALAARKSLTEFLGALKDGDYDIAAGLYTGDLRFLRNLNEDVAPDDISELLTRFCEYHDGVCLSAKIVEGEKTGSGTYLFAVQFRERDGSTFTAGDTLISESLKKVFEFRVERVGSRFYVLDLPPIKGAA